MRIELAGEANAWLSLDGKPSEELRVGEYRTLNCDNFTVAGNPLDPWRIVVWVRDAWRMEDLSTEELQNLLARIPGELSRRAGTPQP